jgi:FKBP-type peptidyl-prolyl cis-trans isomerase
MKKTIGLMTLLAGLALMSMAQTKPTTKPAAKPAPKPVAKPAPPKPFQLKTSLDSLSYALGVLDGGFFKQQGLAKLNYTALQQGFKDVIEGGSPLLSPQDADRILRQKLQDAANEKIKPNIEEAEKSLAENRKRPEVKTTATGLQYEVIKLGTGPMPSDTNTVKVHYVGTLLNGTKFDSSRDRGEPAQFPLGGVIAGWTEGLQLMPVGSIYKLYIPYNLGYGAQGSPPVIPGGALLIFEVELLEIVAQNP